MDSSKEIAGFSWKNRRRTIWVALIWHAAIISFLVVADLTAMAQIVVPVLASSGAALLLGYTLGAVAENIFLARSGNVGSELPRN